MEARQIGTKRPRDSSEGNTVLGYAEFPGSVPGLLNGVIGRKKLNINLTMCCIASIKPKMDELVFIGQYRAREGNLRKTR